MLAVQIFLVFCIFQESYALSDNEESAKIARNILDTILKAHKAQDNDMLFSVIDDAFHVTACEQPLTLELLEQAGITMSSIFQMILVRAKIVEDLLFFELIEKEPKYGVEAIFEARKIGESFKLVDVDVTGICKKAEKYEDRDFLEDVYF